MKTAYLAGQRCRGDVSDPFLEADQRETAKQEAAAKRVHPTLHLPANSQPSTPVAGLFASSATPVVASAQQTSVATSGSLLGSASTPSLFSSTTPAFGSTASAGGSLFSTPFASGAATGSGASFGAVSKSSRPKSQTARH